MGILGNSVSLHPYFRVQAGRLDDVRALLPAFVAKTQKEPANLYYGFTLNGDEVFCREAYVDAAGVLAHLGNVGPELERMLSMASLIRLEVHGPAAELARLREPLAGLSPAWFVCDVAVDR